MGVYRDPIAKGNTLFPSGYQGPRVLGRREEGAQKGRHAPEHTLFDSGQGGTGGGKIFHSHVFHTCRRPCRMERRLLHAETGQMLTEQDKVKVFQPDAKVSPECFPPHVSRGGGGQGAMWGVPVCGCW